MPVPDLSTAPATQRPGHTQRRRPAARDERSMRVLEILMALTAASAALALSMAR